MVALAFWSTTIVFPDGDTMMYQHSTVGGAGGGGGANNGSGSVAAAGQSQNANHGHVPNCQSLPSSGGDGDEDVWRGHSIAALRRRASELNATSIPSYLHTHNYEHHNSVY
uniref:OAR domain-containing protein n=1 Tax=Lutzomyia longipalpis TaxID=7200 RepID=A0A1B0GH68_LUTLO